MRRLLLLLMGAGLVLALAGPAPAGIELLPPDFSPDDYEPGVYMLYPEEGGSWKQAMWVKPWEGWGAPTHYQFRICTNPAEEFGDGMQAFEPVGFEIKGYTVSPSDTPWTVSYASHLGVDNALMWASGVNPATSQGEFITLQYLQGTIDTYVGPPQYFDVPEFVLQVQAYQGDVRKFNGEWYFDGTVGLPDYEGYVSPWHGGKPERFPLASGETHDPDGFDKAWACPEWTLNSPIPEPASLAVWGALGGLGMAGAWWRRRRKAA